MRTRADKYLPREHIEHDERIFIAVKAVGQCAPHEYHRAFLHRPALLAHFNKAASFYHKVEFVVVVRT